MMHLFMLFSILIVLHTITLAVQPTNSKNIIFLVKMKYLSLFGKKYLFMLGMYAIKTCGTMYAINNGFLHMP